GRLRAAGDHRLHRRAEGADPEPRRGRGHDPEEAQPVSGARLGNLLAEHAPPGRLRGEGAQIQDGDDDFRGFRLRLRADGRLTPPISTPRATRSSSRAWCATPATPRDSTPPACISTA